MPQPFPPADFVALADFRYEIRRFLSSSENLARAAGIEPQQHQLMLALKGLPAEPPTIGQVAERLQIRHHSAVGLAGRSATRGLVRRVPSKRDARAVTLVLTARGERLLAQLSVAHRRELRSAAPVLVQSLTALLSSSHDPAERPAKLGRAPRRPRGGAS